MPSGLQVTFLSVIGLMNGKPHDELTKSTKALIEIQILIAQLQK